MARSAPTSLVLVSVPRSASRTGLVRPPSVSPARKTREPPMIAPSSMKEPIRAASVATRSGPACTTRAYPTSAASTCHPPPSVPAKPNTHAARPPRPPDCPASGVDKANRVANIGIMDRRTFVLLTGAASSALVRPLTTLDPPRPPGAAGSGRLRFELDEKRRWSLWYSSEGQPRLLIKDAAVGVWVGDQLVTLADLQDSTVGPRRPAGGQAVVVRGRAAGVFIEVEFLAAEETAAPQAAVTVTIYPDRY